MNNSLKVLFCGAMVAISFGLVSGCSSKNSADAEFERQIRQPIQPPPADIVKLGQEDKARMEAQAAKQAASPPPSQ